MALTQNFHVISVLKRHKETFHGTNLELSCDICVDTKDCSHNPEISVLKRHKETVHGTNPHVIATKNFHVM